MAEGERGGEWLPPNDSEKPKDPPPPPPPPVPPGWVPPSSGQEQGGWSPPSQQGGWQPQQPQQGWGQQGGWGQPQWGGPPVSPTNGKATAALVLGILGIVFCPLLCSIPALILGYAGRREIDASQGRQTNRGMAIAGIVMGWIGVAFGVVIVILALAGAFSEDSSTGFGEPAMALASRLLLALPV